MVIWELVNQGLWIITVPSCILLIFHFLMDYVQTKQWLLSKLARVSQITRANLARRVKFFSNMTFGEFWRVWRVWAKCHVNILANSSLASPSKTGWRMSASLASPAHFWKRPFWWVLALAKKRVLEFAKFARELPLLSSNPTSMLSLCSTEMSEENILGAPQIFACVGLGIVSQFISLPKIFKVFQFCRRHRDMLFW